MCGPFCQEWLFLLIFGFGDELENLVQINSRKIDFSRVDGK